MGAPEVAGGAPTLRRCAPHDAPALAALEGACFPSPWSEAQVVSELRRPGGLALLATYGPAGSTTHRVVGYALFRRVLDEAELLRLAVLPAERRRGLGALLLESGLQQVREGGCASAFLEVSESNGPALRFYERNGWRLVGRRAGYYADGAAALLYRRDL
jgi:ribosomal-protein-alanine N-acetyltransferase